MITELKGALWAQMIAEGKSGHGAMPWECDNPIPRLMQATLALLERFPAGTSDEWAITVSPTELTGSDAFNRVPGEASCILDVRFPADICRSAADALAHLSRFLPAHCRLEMIVSADPLHTDPETPMVQRIKRIAEEVIGRPVLLGREHGSSDARSFGAHGIPAFLYGPTGGDLHGATEWASIPSLLQHVEINRRLLRELSVKD
jgi:succinyl-diaminopimelate desuccinylase